MDRMFHIFGYRPESSNESPSESGQTSTPDVQTHHLPRDSIFRRNQSQSSAPIVRQSPPNGFLNFLGPKLPLHERLLNHPIDPQSASPLLNGTLPPEIRTKIFDYALEEYITSEYPIDTPYTRPNNTGKLTVTIALLATCRLIYLETYHIPLIKTTHIFYHASIRGPNPTTYPNIHSFDHETAYFSKLQPWQHPLVQKVHLYTQMFWLEHHECFVGLCKKPFMQSVKSLKVLIRRGDWWYNERNQALQLNPFRSSSDSRIMMSDMNTAKAGLPLQLSPGEHAWGNAFHHLQGLKELEIEFETSEDKKGELDEIIEWAKTWVFPAAGKSKVLQVEDEVHRWSWETPVEYWSVRCPYCNFYNNCRAIDGIEQREECTERMKKKREGKGPVCYVASVKWKVVDSSGVSRRSEKRRLVE